MNKLITFLVVVILTTVSAETAFACSCAGPARGTPLEKVIADDYARTFAVFVGDVTLVRHNVNRIRENGQELIGLGTIDVTFKVKIGRASCRERV